jgi:hypothetical protein
MNSSKHVGNIVDRFGRCCNMLVWFYSVESCIWLFAWFIGSLLSWILLGNIVWRGLTPCVWWCERTRSLSYIFCLWLQHTWRHSNPTNHLRSPSFVDVVFCSKEETFWCISCRVIFFCSNEVILRSFELGPMWVSSNLTSWLRMTFLILRLNNM